MIRSFLLLYEALVHDTAIQETIITACDYMPELISYKSICKILTCFRWYFNVRCFGTINVKISVHITLGRNVEEVNLADVSIIMFGQVEGELVINLEVIWWIINKTSGYCMNSHYKRSNKVAPYLYFLLPKWYP